MPAVVSASKSAGRGKSTTYGERCAILEWLEIPENLAIINGNATKDLKMVTAGAKVNKATAYCSLAAYVNNKTGSNWTGENAKSRLAAWMKIFKETSRDYENSGGAKYCLSAVDLNNGLNLEDKLEEDCPFYRRMETLFGGRQNVMPSHVWQSSQLQQTQYPCSQMGQMSTYELPSSSDDDDDNDNEDDETVKDNNNEKSFTDNAPIENTNASYLQTNVLSNPFSQSTSFTLDKQHHMLPGQTTTVASKSIKKRQGKSGEVTETLKNISSITMRDVQAGVTG